LTTDSDCEYPLHVSVLRLGHRLVRDDRTTTHVALVSRAFGCKNIYMAYSDNRIVDTIEDINERWGGQNEFKVELVNDWRSLIRSWKSSEGIIVHLTMYGINVREALPPIKIKNNILVVVGASKVPREVYSMADYNIAIGHQPHSEVAALAVFLDRLFEGRELARSFKNAKMSIIPSQASKRIRLEE
jgi:tRNA (cytidine56-2'-O)-methyltransferase